MKVAITIKTNLTYDGRVLAQLNTLSDSFPNYIFRIFVLEDGPFKESLPSKISYKKVNLLTRKLPKSKLFQFIKLLEYGVVLFLKLFFFKPDIIHVHDAGSILGPILYKQLFKNNFLIYDDHELLYEDEIIPFYQKIMKRLERRMFRLADQIIMANNERFEYAKTHIGIIKKKPVTIIENYHFTKNQSDTKNDYIIEKSPGYKYLLHQGVINEARGLDLLRVILVNLPDDWKLLLIGIKKDAYNQFVSFNKDLIEKTVFGGYIPYHLLNAYWEQVDGAVIFYQTDSINNKLCAPNRLYQAANLGIPIIVNENPVLSKFVYSNLNGIALSEGSKMF